ncbi:MAG: hypothetical protein KAT30_04560 [Candidatus Krumholzibacteria bacterium]|nr:hypothetical protein [Candidatus Krumholzibacteria bacterium]MCK5408602.1 hypothetical protein [Candidatus Krumholzibacteria bacterium]MCK5618719.1 hypothetical protein [Candidatus Krumholzibacteria bacterium]
MKTLELMSGFEPMPYALRMGPKRMMKTIDEALVDFLAMVSGAVGSSIEGRFVSPGALRPELYSQKN